ncbi:Macrophage activating glycoprotein [Pseudozyma hubeiensis]|nr:Macrophage activating glycoprotein [Pseudozyma hubeiensis]
MLFSKAVSSVVGATVLAATAVTAQSSVPAFTYGTANPDYPGVKSTNKNGPTNPSAPQLNTPINQTSVSRLASINSIDDWCTFAPPGTGQPLADVEEITVAYCTKPRNNARVIPDGSVTGAHFVKTPLYVQLMAVGDFTSIGFMQGDEGGELDPHGATNMGNPVGGNVTSNVSGEDVFYEEWMNYASYNQICFRVCIAGSEEAPTALECQHTLDVMGCNFVMPGNYADQVFETCDGDSAYPPGLYPEGNGQTSTFVQYFTGEYAVGGTTYSYTNGAADETTPTAAYSTPSTSNCKTTATISNGIKSLIASASSSTSSSSAAKGSKTSSGSSASSTGSSGSSGSSSGSSGSSGSGSSSSAATTSGASKLISTGSAAAVALVAVVAGAMML